jgi:hypothetical protein
MTVKYNAQLVRPITPHIAIIAAAVLAIGISHSALANTPLAAQATAPIESNGANAQCQGLQVIQGPIESGFYNNVCIISNSVGVENADDATINNSIIIAPVCVELNGSGLSMSGDTLHCNLCVKFDSGFISGNSLQGNSCDGQLTNRPNIFGQ